MEQKREERKKKITKAVLITISVLFIQCAERGNRLLS